MFEEEMGWSENIDQEDARATLLLEILISNCRCPERREAFMKNVKLFRYPPETS